MSFQSKIIWKNLPRWVRWVHTASSLAIAVPGICLLLTHQMSSVWLGGLLAISALLHAAGSVWLIERSQLREKRLYAGLCPACGYDLRGSKDRCPECGREIQHRT